MIEVSEERFEELVSEALDSLPPEFASHFENVAVMVENGSLDSPLLGLYQGVPLTKRTLGYTGVTPDRITIFRLPILARSSTEAEVKEQVRRTVLHEVGHYFGIGDRRLRELGW